MNSLMAIAKNRFVQGLLVCLLIGVIYSNTLHAPMHFDDYPNISQNQVVASLVYYTNPDMALSLKVGPFFVRRYFGFLSFALNYHFHKLDVEGYHAVNIAIHALCALAVFWLVRLMFQTPRVRDAVRPHVGPLVALSTALLFAVHPLQTQAVTYIVQRFTSLMALFYLLAMAMYLKARMSEGRWARWGWIAGAIACTVVSMRTKENAFTIPFALALMEWAFFNAGGWRRWAHLLPFALTLLIIPLSLSGSIGVAEMSEMTRLKSPLARHEYFFTQLRVLVTYLRLMVLPINQNLDYDYPVYRQFFTGPVMASSTLLLTMLASSVWLLRTNWGKVAGYGILFFFLAISVESSFIPIEDVIFEHRMYLPSMGLILAACALGFILIHKPRAVMAAVLAMTVALSVATYRRNEVWGTSQSLWQDAANKSPKKGRPLANLGVALEGKGRNFEAMVYYSRAIELNPTEGTFHDDLGGSYFAMGEYDKALEEYKRAVELDPWAANSRGNLGTVYIELGMLEQGIREIKIALSMDANFAGGYYYLGKAYMTQGKPSEAVPMFERALPLAPERKKQIVQRDLDRARAALRQMGSP